MSRLFSSLWMNGKCETDSAESRVNWGQRNSTRDCRRSRSWTTPKQSSPLSVPLGCLYVYPICCTSFRVPFFPYRIRHLLSHLSSTTSNYFSLSAPSSMSLEKTNSSIFQELLCEISRQKVKNKIFNTLRSQLNIFRGFWGWITLQKNPSIDCTKSSILYYLIYFWWDLVKY